MNDDLQCEKNYGAWRAYGNSKLASNKHPYNSASDNNRYPLHKGTTEEIRGYQCIHLCSAPWFGLYRNNKVLFSLNILSLKDNRNMPLYWLWTPVLGLFAKTPDQVNTWILTVANHLVL
jgi:hypothetical protein